VENAVRRGTPNLPLSEIWRPKLSLRETSRKVGFPAGQPPAALRVCVQGERERMFALLREAMEDKRPQWMPQLVEDEYEDASKAQFWKKQVKNDTLGPFRNSSPSSSPPSPFLPLRRLSPPLCCHRKSETPSKRFIACLGWVFRNRSFLVDRGSGQHKEHRQPVPGS
jgi:hypothetical protein